MKLEYIISGEQHETTLLFLHGAGASARQFDNQHEAFADRYKVVSLSLRGHGGSPVPVPNSAEAYALETMGGDILELIEELDLQQIHCIGNSAGGVLGFEVCSRMPERFRSLITYGTTGRMGLSARTGDLYAAIDRFMLRHMKERYIRFLAKHTGMNPDAREAIRRLFETSVEGIPPFRKNLATYDYLDTIARLPMPYRLIRCEHDKGINGMLEGTLEAIGRNPRAAVVELKGVGHVANLDDPQRFNRFLEELMTEIEQEKQGQ